jgi:NarL family two-component system response regulator LiaR
MLSDREVTQMSKPSQHKITILLAEDQPVTSAGIRSILEQADDMQLVGEARDGYEAQQLVGELRPQVLLLDLKMPGPRPSEIEKWVREHYPETITLVLTSHDRDAFLAAMMDAGVSGYLSKNESTDRLLDAIRRAMTGESLFDDEQIQRALRWRQNVDKKWVGLSDRERELLKHLSTGASNKSIAEAMHISLKTVEFHVTNALKKLDMSSREEAMIWMHEHHPDAPDRIKD